MEKSKKIIVIINKLNLSNLFLKMMPLQKTTVPLQMMAYMIVWVKILQPE